MQQPRCDSACRLLASFVSSVKCYSVFAYQQVDIESMIQAVLRFMSIVHSAFDERQMLCRVHHQPAAGQAQCFQRQLLHCGLHPFICGPTEVQQALSQLTVVCLYCNGACEKC